MERLAILEPGDDDGDGVRSRQAAVRRDGRGAGRLDGVVHEDPESIRVAGRAALGEVGRRLGTHLGVGVRGQGRHEIRPVRSGGAPRHRERVEDAQAVAFAEGGLQDARARLVREVDGALPEIEPPHHEARREGVDVVARGAEEERDPGPGEEEERHRPGEDVRAPGSTHPEEHEAEEDREDGLERAVHHGLGAGALARGERQVEEVEGGVVERVLERDVRSARERDGPEGAAGEEPRDAAQGDRGREDEERGEDAPPFHEASRDGELDDEPDEPGRDAEVREESHHSLRVRAVDRLQGQVELVVGDRPDEGDDDEGGPERPRQGRGEDGPQVRDEPFARARAGPGVPRRGRGLVPGVARGQALDDRPATENCEHDQEEQVGGADRGREPAEEEPECDVGDDAPPGDDSEEALGLARVEDVSGDRPEDDHHDVAGRVEHHREGQEEPEGLADRRRHENSREDDECDDRSEGGRDELPGRQAPGRAPVERDGRDEREGREKEPERDRPGRERAQEERAAHDLARDDDASDREEREGEHEPDARTLSGLDPQDRLEDGRPSRAAHGESSLPGEQDAPTAGCRSGSRILIRDWRRILPRCLRIRAFPRNVGAEARGRRT